MQLQPKHWCFGIAFAAALVAQAGQVTAQEPQAPQQQPMCTAQVSPSQLQPGQAATAVNVTVSQAIGEITEVEAGTSGLALAAAGDVPRTPLAAPDEAPRPIRMGDSPTQWIVFLNTSEVEAGEHEITFKSERGECSATLTVGEAR
jgi:hypothetical protein